MAAEDRVDRGLDPADAPQEVLREFSNVALVEDVTRDTWGWKWLDDLRR